jgi:hypothetical protein
MYKAKRRTIYREERGNKMATQAIPPPLPPPPSGDFGAGTHEFSEKHADLWRKVAGFEIEVAHVRKKWQI